VAATAERAPAAGHPFAPSGAFTAATPLAERLKALAGPSAPGRNREVAVESGVLICGACARWFPILDSLPELLPDHLRDAARDEALLDTLAVGLPADIRRALRAPGADGAAADIGLHYKRAEIGIVSKLDNPSHFFGPGYLSPFNPGNTDFTLYLISLFGNVVKLLGVNGSSPREVILDSGCGYSWTTEWLAKSGFEVIGVDICRAYLEVGIRRIGESHPHLVVADVENLPIADACADAVLAYESFHHIPDRVKAMAGYARILKDRASVVLAEPGEDHESAAVSVDVMSRYGILERGMELEDVEGYIAGSPFGSPEQLWVMHASAAELERGINLPSAWRHSVFPGNVFRVKKDASRIAAIPAASRSTSPSAPKGADADPPSSPDEDLRALHARMTHEWSTEVRRLSAELRRLSGELTALKRSPFWRARRMCLRVMAHLGSDRAGVALKSGT
jgi:SAM-dependent methyltransferase/uncharacterized protein YbaR (Trm112 family)